MAVASFFSIKARCELIPPTSGGRHQFEAVEALRNAPAEAQPALAFEDGAGLGVTVGQLGGPGVGHAQPAADADADVDLGVGRYVDVWCGP